MQGTTLEVAMLADISGAYSTISSVNLCVTGSLWLRHSLWVYLTLIGHQNFNGAATESWWFAVEYELRCQFINNNDFL